MSDAIVMLVRVLRLWPHVHQPVDPELVARRKRQLYLWTEIASCREKFQPARRELMNRSAAMASHGSRITTLGQEKLEKKVGRPIALGMRRACQIAFDRAQSNNRALAPYAREDCSGDPSEVVRLTRVLRIWARMARIKQRGSKCDYPTQKLLGLSALAASATDLHEAETRFRARVLLEKQAGGAGYGGTGGAPTRLLAHALWKRIDTALWIARSPDHRGTKPASGT